jgi:hypothetical protein
VHHPGASQTVGSLGQVCLRHGGANPAATVVVRIAGVPQRKNRRQPLGFLDSLMNGFDGPADDPSGLKNSTRLVRTAATAILPSVVTPIEITPPLLFTNQPTSKSPARS